MQILFAKNKNCNAFSGKMQDKPTIYMRKVVCKIRLKIQKRSPNGLLFCGADETRTRDLRRDRPIF